MDNSMSLQAAIAVHMLKTEVWRMELQSIFSNIFLAFIIISNIF